MTSFVNVTYSTTHPGVARAERVIEAAQALVQRLQQESTYAVVLATFGVLSLIASVYDIVATAEQGQELGAWVVLWTAVLLCMWSITKYVVKTLRALRQAARDKGMWDNVMSDHRVMAELLCASGRDH